MPQPTTNVWPLEMKEFPSADGHTGAAVAGAGAAEDEPVEDELAGAGVVDELPLELDKDGVPLIEPEILVPEGEV